MHNSPKMPLTIRIAEAIAWLYVALCVVLLAHCVHLAYVGKCGGVGDAVIVAVFGLLPLSLPVGMVLSLRYRKRALYLCLHAIVALPVAALWLLEACAGHGRDLGDYIKAIWLLIMFASTFALLFSSEASHWFHKEP